MTTLEAGQRWVPPLESPPRRRLVLNAFLRHPGLVLLFLTAAMAAYFFVNVARAPDFTGDEVLYSVASRHTAVDGQFTWGGAPVLVHPPLYFMLGAGWLKLFGATASSSIAQVHDIRYMSVIFTCAALVVVGRLTLELQGEGESRRLARLVTAVIVVALVATNPVVGRFGRMVLLEPLAIALGLGTVLLAWKLRRAETVPYVLLVGMLGGLALLAKSVSVFALITPFVASVIALDRRRVLRTAGALSVSAVLWLAFPFWATMNGRSHDFWDVQTFSIRRFLGLVQVSGLNRKGVDPYAAVKDTFLQYAAMYMLLLVGGLGLLIALYRFRRTNEQQTFLVAFGLSSYAFVGYNTFFGQSNEQLVMYAIPAAAMLAVIPWQWERRHRLDFSMRSLFAAAAVITIAAGSVSDYAYLLHRDDTGTEKVVRFIDAHFPDCVAINSTGDQFRWGYLLRRYTVAALESGPQAITLGVSVFLLSPKDSRFYYQNSSPELQAWVEANGTKVFEADSHTYEKLEVWTVGEPTVPVGATAPSCALQGDGTVPSADATPFYWALALMLSAGVTVVATHRGLSRRRVQG